MFKKPDKELALMSAHFFFDLANKEYEKNSEAYDNGDILKFEETSRLHRIYGNRFKQELKNGSNEVNYEI